MIITETQRFVYGLLALTFVTISILVLLNVYALEIFLILIIIEFLVLVEVTKPPLIKASWTKNMTILVSDLCYCVCNYTLPTNGGDIIVAQPNKMSAR